MLKRFLKEKETKMCSTIKSKDGTAEIHAFRRNPSQFGIKHSQQ